MGLGGPVWDLGVLAGAGDVLGPLCALLRGGKGRGWRAGSPAGRKGSFNRKEREAAPCKISKRPPVINHHGWRVLRLPLHPGPMPRRAQGAQWPRASCSLGLGRFLPVSRESPGPGSALHPWG